jgi:opacity protein-like surface antigen
MTSKAAVAVLPLLLAATVPAAAHQGWTAGTGSLVTVSVEVEGVSSPLYPAPDGTGRYYVEARRGGRYALRLANRTGERVAVQMTVDGINVISGDKQRADEQGRMYVLDPWESALIQGWRTSLDDVRRFTFVDEQASYAARSGKSNSRMGWIEMSVFRERPRYAQRRPDVSRAEPYGEGSRDDAQAPAAAAPREQAEVRSREDKDEKKAGAAGAYPGTGWGEHAHDAVQLVDFEAQPAPAERITLRYEYASGLRALGILPWRYTRDRLQERDRGEGGFVQPPRW